MGDGSDFNAESGEPRKTLFGVEARFFDEQSGRSSSAGLLPTGRKKAERCFRNPKTTLLHTPRSRAEGNPLPMVADSTVWLLA